MLLLALRRQRAAGERHRDSARGRLRLFQMRAGPRPSRARRARGAAPLGRVAARDLLEVELLSAARRRPHLATHAAQPPGGWSLFACPTEISLPSLRRVRARGLWSSESRRDSRSLRRVERARSRDTLRRGVDRRQRARRLCAPARPARASRGRSRKFPGEHRTRALVPVGTSQLGRQRGRVFPAAKPNRFACALAFCAAHGDLWAGSRLFSKYAISRTRRSVMRWGF